MAIVWLTGPSGVGKSTVAWQLYNQLLQTMHVAVIDTDQLGLMLPFSDRDAANHEIKARNLGAYWRAATQEGVRRLIVAGILPDVGTLKTYTEELGEGPFVIGLGAKAAELRQRVLGRGWNTQLADAAVATASEYSALPFLDWLVDTSSMTPPQVAREITTNLPARSPRRPPNVRHSQLPMSCRAMYSG